MNRLKLLFGILVGVLAFYSNVIAQTGETLSDKELKQMAREAKKEEKARMLAETAVHTQILLESRRFVLEANYLSNHRGTRIPVTPSLNFVMVDSVFGVIQIGNTQGLGYNGVGGITAEGEIRKYELTPLKNNRGYTLSMMLSTSIGAYDILISVSADGYASATLSGNWGGHLTWDGIVVPLGASKVYKGMSY